MYHREISQKTINSCCSCNKLRPKDKIKSINCGLIAFKQSFPKTQQKAIKEIIKFCVGNNVRAPLINWAQSYSPLNPLTAVSCLNN